MGRQAYLTRLALGRSAFEPPTQESASAEVRPFPGSDYVQLYNERGHPINPPARAYARKLRKAQNDVLAAIGVVTRSSSWEDQSDSLQRKRERLSRLEDENSAGGAIGHVSTLLERLCRWWIISLRYRILAFPLEDSTSFVEVIVSVFQASGPSILSSGFIAHVLSIIAVHGSVDAVLAFRPLDRFLLWTRASRKVKSSLQRFKLPLEICIDLCFEALFCPFAYHANLQQLGVLPIRPFLPPWRAFIPFSSYSPTHAVPAAFPLPMGYLAHILYSAARSPAASICVDLFWERWVYSTIYEATESSTIRPNNPDLTSHSTDVEARAHDAVGWGPRSPSYIRSAIHMVLTCLGWGNPMQLTTTEISSGERENSPGIQQVGSAPNLQINDTEINDITPLNLPRAHSEIQPPLEVDNAPIITTAHLPPQQHSEPLSPVSPTGSVTEQDPNDPRIRITSREDGIEMEVRLPSRVSSSTTEEHQNSASNHGAEGVGPSISPPELGRARVSHHVTRLSTEPATMLGEALRMQIVSWAILPLKLITLRLIASHYYTNRPYGVAVSDMKPMRIGMLGLRSGLDRPSLRSIGIFLSRVALCGAMEVAVDLAIWGCQWAVITWTGKRFYGWGSL